MSKNVTCIAIYIRVFEDFSVWVGVGGGTSPTKPLVPPDMWKSFSPIELNLIWCINKKIIGE
jgi:hypothetical protein